jgi:hypothetical protein
LVEVFTISSRFAARVSREALGALPRAVRMERIALGTRIAFMGGLLVLIVTSSSLAYEDGPYYFVSPGIKMSYAFGAAGGFSFGWELSVYRTIAWKPRGDEEGYIGIALSIDWCKATTKVQMGFEGSQRIVGVCVGPTLVCRNNTWLFGGSATIYSWFIGLPYYAYTFVPNGTDVHELGAYFKIPIQLNGKSIFAIRGLGG